MTTLPETIQDTIQDTVQDAAKETFQYEILYTSKISGARVGRITTPHGSFETPSFVAVGTNGSLKGIDNPLAEKLGVDLMFCNTYHLLVQPGTEVIKNGGGLHQYIGRKRPIITDSGGFQVFSLKYGGVASELKSKGTKKNDGSVLKITEEGVRFRSYRDGKLFWLTPETSIQAQKDLGADIIIPFDELPPYHIDAKTLKRSFDRTHRWQKRSLLEHQKSVQAQAIYGVVHGGLDLALRKESCKILREMGFDGFAIGGSLGKNKDEMIPMLKETIPHLPPTHPRHLLGIGDLPSIDEGVRLGIDTFDSSYPTKAARHGLLLTSDGPIQILKRSSLAIYKPLEKDCPCPLCQNHTLSYLVHLFQAKEPTAIYLATAHNISFMARLMRAYREGIMRGEI